jgi:hypothetical protein
MFSIVRVFTNINKRNFSIIQFPTNYDTYIKMEINKSKINNMDDEKNKNNNDIIFYKFVNEIKYIINGICRYDYSYPFYITKYTNINTVDYNKIIDCPSYKIILNELKEKNISIDNDLNYGNEKIKIVFETINEDKSIFKIIK